MSAITLEHLGKTYGNGVRALDDVSLEINDGDWLVLVGASGCGKTTLLRLIAGLEAPTTGTIRLAGRSVNETPPHRRDIAMLFQRPALVSSKTVRENLVWPQYPRARRRGVIDFLQVARLLGIEDLLDRRSDQLSGGQQQRVVLGRALLRKPSVCLLDEPLAHLDAPLRTQLRREIRLLYQQFPATMVFVTHDPADALALGERVAVLVAGRVAQVGSYEEIRRRPKSRFIAEFFHHESPMSFLDGDRTDEGGRRYFVGPWGRWEMPAAVPAEGRAITLGLRAEDVKVFGSGAFDSEIHMMVQGHVSLQEGSAKGRWITNVGPGWRITGSSTETRAYDVGQAITMSFSLDRAFWFDSATGTTLWVPTG